MPSESHRPSQSTPGFGQRPEPRHDREGEVLGGYVIGEAIAEGTMGRVYRAARPDADRPVAIKVLHPASAQDPVTVERFRREFETARALQHEHIIAVKEFGETLDGSYFMTMEYIDGEELGCALQRAGVFDPARMLRVLCQLALGLDHAHDHGVVHRDLKPANILLCDSTIGDDVRILDLGSVKVQESGPKLTAFGTTIGSPHYMSPEQATGSLEVDRRTDVFALAAILYELSTGRVAFDGESPAEILTGILEETPPPISTWTNSYPWAFDDVVKTGLAKDKNERYETTIELANAALNAFDLHPNAAKWARTPLSDVRRALGARPHADDAVPQAKPWTSFPSSPPMRSGGRTWLWAATAVLGMTVASVWALLS